MPTACRKCGASNRKRGRPCSTCHSFYHLTCVGLKYRQSLSLVVWNCASCADKTSSLTCPHSASGTTLDDADSVLRSIASSRVNRRILLRIPKGARISAADSLSRAIDSALDGGSAESWTRVYTFALRVLGLPTGCERSASLVSTIKAQAQSEEAALPATAHRPQTRAASAGDGAQFNVRRLVDRKLAEDVKPLYTPSVNTSTTTAAKAM